MTLLICYLEQLGVIDTMDRLNELLEYIQRTNPDMTKEKLIKELKQCSYTAKSLIFTEQNFCAAKNF